MQITVHQNHWLPKFIKKGAITLYPYIFLNCDLDTALQCNLLQHEWIHILQIQRIGFFKFYFTYIIQFLHNFLIYRSFSKAYSTISYEEEAYSNQHHQSVPLSQIVLK